MTTRHGIAALAALISIFAAACAHHSAAPDATARSLYQHHFSGDMGFTPELARSAGRWLTPELRSQIEAYFAVPRPDDEVPPINGDPFTDSQEYPERFEVGVAAVSGDTARVPVTFPWPDGPRSLELVLRLSSGSWLVDDIRYADGRTFREMLRAE